MTQNSTERLRIAIYDMDKTVTRRPTYAPFLWFVICRYRPWRMVLIPLMLLFGAGYGLKLVSRPRLKELNLALALGRQIDRVALTGMAQAFARHTFDTNLLADAVSRISADRNEGYHLVLATASFRFYAGEIGRAAFGFDAVIGTECQTRDSGTLVPLIDGENCYGPVKLQMVKAWLADQGIAREAAHIRFYSDHVTDEPCLAWADEAFAVNPHGPLRTLAAQRAWPVYDWV
ncbi:MAG: hypothetical protein RL367_1811 [Pseudomonadota bacterium]